MTILVKSLVAAFTTTTAAAGTVAAVNHTEFGQSHAPECVKKACKVTEDKTVQAAKASYAFSKEKLADLKAQIKKLSGERTSKTNRAKMADLNKQVVIIEGEFKTGEQAA